MTGNIDQESSEGHGCKQNGQRHQCQPETLCKRPHGLMWLSRTVELGDKGGGISDCADKKTDDDLCEHVCGQDGFDGGITGMGEK